MSDLCTLGSRPGMECVPLRSPADPYHYHHVTDQTKSLQELQNEVGALLEFRDLVIETFPDLKTKMASASAANSTLTGIPSSSLASSRREWEPGIRTRRKLTQKDHLSHHQQISSVTTVATVATIVTNPGALPTTTTSSTEIHPHHHQHQHPHSLISRSRSNSHSGGSSSGGSSNRKEPKSGDAQSSGSVVIQDSGFSTETSSSKETHSASSSTGAGGNATTAGTIVGGGIGGRLTADSSAEDELWNLLDVIHRKSNRLREEVDALQQLEREKCRTNQNQNAVGGVIGGVAGSSSSSSSSVSNSNNNNHHHIHSSSSGSSNLPHLAKTFQNLVSDCPVVNSSSSPSNHHQKDDVQILRRERDRLFEQLSDYEAEAMAGRIRAAQMQGEVDVLAAAKRDLESQLAAALSQKSELNGRIHDLHQQFVGKGSAPSSPDSIKSRHHHPLTPSSAASSHLRKHSSTDSTTTTICHLSSTSSPATTSSPSSNSQHHHLLKPSATRFSAASSSFAPVVKSVPTKAAPAEPVDHSGTSPAADLGKLDGLLSSPARVNKVRVADSKKIAAILLETNIVELQRHLLTITVQNQVLQQRLDHATRSRIFLSKKLDKSKEDIDDLKFRLEEKTIELEGTKAQLRVLESKQQQQSGKSSVASSGFSPEHHPSGGGGGAAVTVTTVPPTASVKPSSSVVATSAGGIVSSHLASPVHQPYHQRGDLTLRLGQSQVSTPSMKAMVPLAMDEILHHSSSTESAQDQQERLQYPETPKRKPSKIPLPGTKGYVAPKPPTGRNFVANVVSSKGSPSPSGSLSNKSLNKSTGSLYMRSTGPSSITSRGAAVGRDSSMNRPESAQSWTRRDTSLEKSRSSSIPVSSKGSPVSAAKPPMSTVVSSSPQPKAKRDSLTTRVKNLDSLSRLQTSSASASTGNLSKSSSKKDLSSTSFSTGQIGGRKQNSGAGSGIRRVSSASIGRSSSTERNNNNGSSAASAMASPTDATGSDNGKVRNIRSSFWNWLKI